MHTFDAHGLPYLISSSGVVQFQEACYTVVSYAPYILLQIYTITILATFSVTIFDFFHPGPQPIYAKSNKLLFCSVRNLAYFHVGLFLTDLVFLITIYTVKPVSNGNSKQ